MNALRYAMLAAAAAVLFAASAEAQTVSIGTSPQGSSNYALGNALGKGLAVIQNVLDLNAIVFSGGVSASFDLIEPHIRASLRKHVFGSPAGDVPLLVSELGERAGVIGAAHLTTL